MKSIQETIYYLLYFHGSTAPVKPNVPMYLGNMQRLLNTEQGYITGKWMRRMFEAVVNVLVGHDLTLNGSRGLLLQCSIPADLADLQHVLEVITAEAMFLNGETTDVADATPGYHADLLHMHLELARALVAWENNEWEAHTVNPVIRIAALLVLRTQAWLNHGVG